MKIFDLLPDKLDVKIILPENADCIYYDCSVQYRISSWYGDDRI